MDKNAKGTKVVTIRLPVSDYEKLQPLCDTLGFSLSKLLASLVHMGLLFADEAFEEAKLANPIKRKEDTSNG